MGEDFSVVCFTGHTIEQIRKGAERSKPEWGALLTEVDLLVDGAYDERQRSLGLPLRGSANQRLHFLTDRICEEDVTPSVAEFTLSLDGDLTQTGYPEFPDAVDVFAAVRKLQEGVLT
jgi:anaerobic ribonucleoside-triphosphate reductase activating protein